MFIMAYTTTMDLAYFKHAAACFSNLRLEHVSRIFTCIHGENTQHGHSVEHWIAAMRHWTSKVPLSMAVDILLARYMDREFEHDTDQSSLAPYIMSGGVPDRMDLSPSLEREISGDRAT